MKILIKNAILISMQEGRERVEKDIDILIENDIIAKIGYNLNIELNNDVKVINATNKVVMPGLINTHSHVPMSIFRETLDGYNLQDWLTKKIWPIEDIMTNEDIYYASLLSFVEMIESGCTTINDMYFKTDEIIKAMKATGVRLQTTRALMDMISEEEGEGRIKELSRLIKQYKDVPNLSFNAGVHGLYTANEPYIEKCAKFAKENDIILHMHFCENTKEVQDIKDMYNKEPVDIINEYFKGIPTLLAHAVKLTSEDIEKLKELNVSIAHCPISNLKLGCGVCNVAEMIDQGINVSLGTDGQGTGCSLDMFEVMKITGLLQKGIIEDASIMNSYDVLKMATINGAKALGMEDKIGSIEEGKQADIIIVNIQKTQTIPQNDIISEIVYNINGSDVETTIVAGNILMEDKFLEIGIDKEKLYYKCESIIENLSK